MAIYLKPHTEEWFVALVNFDPMQAAMTRTAIKTAGSTEVCSVCADDPAKDYQIDAASIPNDAVATLRLCEDCLGIRKAGGEEFRPWP
jgi:hypothetical protein